MPNKCKAWSNRPKTILIAGMIGAVSGAILGAIAYYEHLLG